MADGSPTNQYCNHQTGMCFAKLGKPEIGIKYFRKSITAGDSHKIDAFILYYSAGKCCMDVKKYK